MARLAIIKAKREADRLKRESEGRAPGWTKSGVESSDDDDSDSEDDKKPAKSSAPVAISTVAAKKKAAAAETTTTEPTVEVLKSMDIKKMNADALKDHLKARNLDYQGQKKDLIKRLCDYEATR